MYGTGLHVIFMAKLPCVWALEPAFFHVGDSPLSPVKTDSPFKASWGRNNCFLPRICMVVPPTQIHIHNHFSALLTYGNVFLPSFDCGLLISWCFLEHNKYSKDLMNKQINWLVSLFRKWPHNHMAGRGIFACLFLWHHVGHSQKDWRQPTRT